MRQEIAGLAVVVRRHALVGIRREQHQQLAVEPDVERRDGRDLGRNSGGSLSLHLCELAMNMSQGKGPLFENSTRDDLSSQDMSGN